MKRKTHVPQDLQQPVQGESFLAEQALLGAILVRPEVFPRILDAGITEKSFRGRQALIFKVMHALYVEGAPVDLASVNIRLNEMGLLEKAGGPVFLAELSEQTGYATNSDYYAHQVLKDAWRREYQQTTLELYNLERKTGADANEDLLTFLSSKLIDLENSYPGAYAQQSPLILLDELLRMEFPETSDLIADGIWPAEGGLIWAGESGEGKSLILILLALHLAMGWDFLGLKIPTARRVVIFQAENTLKTEKDRFRRMLEGLGITQMPPNIALYEMRERLDLASERDRKKIMAAIKSHKADAFLLDPLISFHTVPENDNVGMRRVLDFVTEISRKTGAGCALAHHFGKPTENRDIEHRIRGATAIRDWADTLIALTKKKTADGKFLKQLTFVKVRNGKQPKPILAEEDENFILTVAEEESRFPPEQVAAIIRAKGGRVNRRQELVEAIQEVIKCGERTARKFIQAAIDDQKILVIPGEREQGKAGPIPNAYIPNDQGNSGNGQ
jgi:RecA-family ATPase